MGLRKPTRQWRRWHRWLGLLVAVPVLILSVTGVLLNHIDAFGWSNSPLPPMLARWYGAPVPVNLQGRQINGQWYAQTNERLFIGERDAFYCQSPFRGATSPRDLIIVGCGDELLLLNEAGQAIERVGSAFGVPAFSELGTIDGKLALKTPDGLVRFDVDHLISERVDPQSQWQPSTLVPLPSALADQIRSQSVPPSLNWQRLLLDLHAGRVLGFAGQLLMDLAALMLSILAVTGTVIWARSRR
ncbi:PepSY domain-containing protein [Alcanivorax sp.]|uniref:PepSY domain-containing protein n=1 Tax=Alcanivorax sp. TaxID=1872427 RepID=UPI0025B93D79|nr:PepSY domain-containing protein [Alcanivorax sp.]